MAEKISLRKQKKFQARQTILKAAAQQFELHGFANTSIAGIMQAARLGVGTFYNYFSSKEDVLLTLAKNLRVRVEKSIAAAKKNQSNVAGTFRAVLRVHVQTNRRKPIYLAAVHKCQRTFRQARTNSAEFIAGVQGVV